MNTLCKFHNGRMKMNMVYTALSRIRKRLKLLNGDYIACTDADNKLAGYFCQGESACIPTKESFCYSDDRLDIGLGMHPALCGKGMGYDFVLSGIKYLSQQRPDIRFCLAVPSVYKRAYVLNREICSIFFVVLNRRTSSTPHSSALKIKQISTVRIRESKSFELDYLQGT